MVRHANLARAQARVGRGGAVTAMTKPAGPVSRNTITVIGWACCGMMIMSKMGTGRCLAGHSLGQAAGEV